VDDAARRAVAGVRSADVGQAHPVGFLLFSDEALTAFDRAISG
jgi:hypothetical protein